MILGDRQIKNIEEYCKDKKIEKTFVGLYSAANISDFFDKTV